MTRYERYKRYRRILKGMRWYKQIYWYLKISSMDNNPFIIDCFRIMDYSDYYLYTPEEFEAEKQRRLSILREKIDSMKD